MGRKIHLKISPETHNLDEESDSESSASSYDSIDPATGEVRHHESHHQKKHSIIGNLSDFTKSRNEMRERIMREVTNEILPDIGAYDLDAAPPPVQKLWKGPMVSFCKFLGFWPKSLHELVLDGYFADVDKYCQKITSGDNPRPELVNQYHETLGQTPLSFAIKAKNKDIVEVLLSNGAIPDLIDQDTGRTPLFYSVLNGTHDLSKLLLDNGASVNMADYNAVTPLMLAVMNNDLKHCMMLNKKSAEVDAQDINGWTPLHYGAWKDAPRCLKFLLNEGARRDIKDINGRSALHMARFRQYGDCISALEDMKAKMAFATGDDF